MDLSIIILAWNSKDFLQRCLDSISARDIEYEIIVIDNASSDDTIQMIEKEYPDVTFIKNDKNMGLPARNQGLSVAKGKYILLLDVDTIVQPDSIDTLVSYLDRNPDIGLVAARLTDKDGTLQYTCHKFPTVISKILRRTQFNWAKKFIYKVEYRNWDHNTIREVDYVTGACQMIRREAYSKVGPIDSNIIYGPEDVDYCLRVWQSGYKVVYNPNAVIIHAERRITTKSWFTKTTWDHVKGLTYFFLKHRYFFSRKKIYKSIPFYCYEKKGRFSTS